MSDMIGPSEWAVLLAPFWGPSPNSNRWSDFEYVPTQSDVYPSFDGGAVKRAVYNGWLYFECNDVPGYMVPDPDEGGDYEFHWRYYAVPVFQTIMRARALRQGVRYPS